MNTITSSFCCKFYIQANSARGGVAFSVGSLDIFDVIIYSISHFASKDKVESNGNMYGNAGNAEKTERHMECVLRQPIYSLFTS